MSQVSQAQQSEPLAVVRRGSNLQVDRILSSAVDNGASDVHFAVGRRPMLHVNGELVPVNTIELTAEDVEAAIKQITASEKILNQIHEEKNADFSYALPGSETRFRVNVCQALGGKKITMRRLPDQILTMEQIGLPSPLLELITRPRGLILVTGPTGSGKTTSIASMLTRVVREQSRNLITIEDPVEYTISPGPNSIVTQREIGDSVPSFEAGLRTALRQAPDIIMVGEMRDLEPARIALRAAETGHLVISTLHTNSAAETISRIIDMFPEGEREHVQVQVSMALLGVVCQELLRKKGGSGRVASFEFMLASDAVRSLIRAGKVHQLGSVIQTSGKEGMILRDDHLSHLVRTDQVTFEAALEKSQDPKRFAERFKRMH